MSMPQIYVTVAASNTRAGAKADFVCEGIHDEFTLQAAIDRAVQEDKNILLLNGRYAIDSFVKRDDGGPDAALVFPNAHREICMIGQNNEYGFHQSIDNGVVFYVSSEALKTSSAADVIRITWTPRGIQNGSSLRLENIAVVLDHNQSAVRCIDLRRTDRVEIKNATLIAYGAELLGGVNVLGVAPKVPVPGCIGLTMTDGSNYNYSNYTNVFAYGFDEGLQVGGEHVVCINCGAALGRYGYTFGNYEVDCGCNHPITLISCLDERNINLPLFGTSCGDADGKGGRLIGEQEIMLISYNIEHPTHMPPGGKPGLRMRELIPGSWKGTIDFTAQPIHWHTNDKAFRLWEEDGSGIGITTRNACHKPVCSTAERLSYYPTRGQQLFDTDLNKMVVCIDPAKRLWVDFCGNPV